MRLIRSMTILSVVLWMAASTHAATVSPGLPSITQAYPESTVLCLDHEVRTDLADVSITPVYDWMHAGQQGIKLTVANKTDKNLVIDWGTASRQRRSAVEIPGDGSRLSMEPGSRGFYDVIAPGATFSKTLWPPSGSQKAGILENRRVYLSAATERGSQQHEELVLDVSGETRICSR